MGLDVVLLASGILMGLSYLSSHREPAAAAVPAAPKPVQVETMPPTPVRDSVVTVANPPDDKPPASAEEKARVAKLIEAEVERNQARLERCYADAERTRPASSALAGRLELRFAIGTDGRATRVRVLRNTTDSSVLAECVQQLVASFKVKDAPVEAVAFSWPFVFRGDE
jgi:hypothetical protein